jgi:hypothetical protein
MSIGGTFSVGGAIVMWKLGDRFRRTDIERVLDGFGWKKYTPAARTPGAVLKEVMQKMWKGKIVRQMQDSSTFSLHDEVRGKDVHDANRYPQYGAATIVKRGGEWVVVTEGRITRDETCVLQAYFDMQEDLVTHHQVSKALVDLMGAELDGESCRDMGGVYWIPAERMQLTEQLTDELVVCTEKGNSRFYVFTARKDDRMLDAVADMVQENATKQLDGIREDVLDEKSGERLLGNRLKEVEQINSRLERYSERLGVTLDEARKALLETKKLTLQAAVRAATAKQAAGKGGC